MYIRDNFIFGPCLLKPIKNISLKFVISFRCKNVNLNSKKNSQNR